MTTPGADRVNFAFIGLIVAVATIGGFMFGYDSGVINGTQEGLNKAFDLSKLGTGLTVGAILLGCAAGAFIAGRLADVIGRRSVMMIAAVLFVFSALGAGAAHSAIMFIIARIIGGLGVGAASVLAPVYISEVVPANIRGRLSSIQQVMIITGLTGAFFANYALAHSAGGSTQNLWFDYPAWRWMFWLQVIPAVIYLFTLLLIPESPRYLAMKGRDAEAEGVLTKLFGADHARDKVAEIRDSLAADHHRPKFSDLLEAGGKVRPIVWAGIGLAVFQQFVGINIVFYYGSVLWQQVGFSENDSLIINIISGLVSIAACLVTIFTVDKIGRKPLLLIGSVGMAVTLALMAYAFSTATVGAHGPEMSSTIGKIALASALAYSALFNLSWGPIMWVMLGEMFPNQIRGSGLAVSGLAQWGANFLISVSFPWMAANAGLPMTYGFYAASAFVSYFFVKALVNETKGRELEDMVG